MVIGFLDGFASLAMTQFFYSSRLSLPVTLPHPSLLPQAEEGAFLFAPELAPTSRLRVRQMFQNCHSEKVTGVFYHSPSFPR
jgi:hypothetical protein